MGGEWPPGQPPPGHAADRRIQARSGQRLYQYPALLCAALYRQQPHSVTRYFANNNAEHFRFDADERFLPVYRWATPDNKKVTYLDDFAEAFLAKCTLAEMISRYMVLIQTERRLVLMRPYQIYAVKAIVDCIQQNRGNGYIWHTTGSGKTLTTV
jgi:type I restriction enzyme R subunit